MRVVLPVLHKRVQSLKGTKKVSLDQPPYHLYTRIKEAAPSSLTRTHVLIHTSTKNNSLISAKSFLLFWCQLFFKPISLSFFQPSFLLSFLPFFLSTLYSFPLDNVGRGDKYNLILTLDSCTIDTKVLPSSSRQYLSIRGRTR